jgi:hypothetical protein
LTYSVMQHLLAVHFPKSAAAAAPAAPAKGGRRAAAPVAEEVEVEVQDDEASEDVEVSDE